MKGTALADVARLARAAGQEFADALSEPTRHVLSGAVLSGSWYPERVLRELLEALAAVRGGTLEACRELGRALARKDLGSVYHSLFRPGDPGATLAAFPMLWALYHDTGAARVERVPGALHVSVRGFALPSAAVCAYTAGWLEAAVGLASGREPLPAREVACRTAGAAFCEFDLPAAAPGD